MRLIVDVEKVAGGFTIGAWKKEDDSANNESAVASTARQAGIRAGELCRKLIEAEFIAVRNP